MAFDYVFATCRNAQNLRNVGNTMEAVPRLAGKSSILASCQQPAWTSAPNCAGRLNVHLDALGDMVESFAGLHAGVYLGFGSLTKLKGEAYVSDVPVTLTLLCPAVSPDMPFREAQAR